MQFSKKIFSPEQYFRKWDGRSHAYMERAFMFAKMSQIIEEKSDIPVRQYIRDGISYLQIISLECLQKAILQINIDNIKRNEGTWFHASNSLLKKLRGHLKKRNICLKLDVNEQRLLRLRKTGYTTIKYGPFLEKKSAPAFIRWTQETQVFLRLFKKLIETYKKIRVCEFARFASESKNIEKLLKGNALPKDFSMEKLKKGEYELQSTERQVDNFCHNYRFQYS
ncbi:MAG: hypothetical protein Q7T16_00175 [Candidatus Burarchaeum sp.]|nr:hypothetical protein [Candidatus Burarchaeum sp.]MDO8339055.1 hypothetical protein [Candidatus Burarchaeum sp.]